MGSRGDNSASREARHQEVRQHAENSRQIPQNASSSLSKISDSLAVWFLEEITSRLNKLANKLACSS